MHKIVEYIETYELFVFLPPNIRFGHMDIVISKSEEVTFCSKFYKRNQSNKLCMYELVYLLYSFLEYTIVIFHYFYFL